MKSWVKLTMSAGLAMMLAGQAAAFGLSDALGAANKAMSADQDAAAADKGAVGGGLADSLLGSFPVAGDTADLVNQLSGQLGVTPKQAAGGTAALFAQAQSALPASQFSGIADKVSGLSSLLGGDAGNGGGLLKTAASSMGGVDTAFKALGMSPDMVGQFVPVISKFLGGQGVAGGLINSLQGIWGAAG